MPSFTTSHAIHTIVCREIPPQDGQRRANDEIKQGEEPHPEFEWKTAAEAAYVDFDELHQVVPRSLGWNERVGRAGESDSARRESTDTKEVKKTKTISEGGASLGRRDARG